jgi:hypothetical protein
LAFETADAMARESTSRFAICASTTPSPATASKLIAA